MILEQYCGVFEKIYFSPSINIDDSWVVKKYIEEDLGVNTEREQAYYDEWDEAALRGIQRQRKITETSKKLELRGGFNQRPRFEQVVATWSGMSRCPGPAGPQGHHVHHEPLLLGRLRAVQRGPQPAASAAHAPEGNSRGRLPLFCPGHGRGLGPDAQRARKPLRRGRPSRRPRGRRADEQRSGPALHHGPFAQRGRQHGPRGGRSSRARSGAGLPLPAPPGRC